MSGHKKSNNYTQKYILKKICQILYYFGVGEFWYEKYARTAWQHRIYAIWVLVANTYIFLCIFNEILAYTRKDLSAEEKIDLLLFSFAHPSVASKILTVYMKRDHIKAVLYMLLEQNRSVYVRRTLEKHSVRRAKFYCACLFVNIYIILISATIEGIKNYLEKGIPIRTEVTILPVRESSGFLVNIFRFFIQFHWWFIITIMYSIDCLAICSLVFLSYKFKKVRLHFETLRNEVKTEFRKKTPLNQLNSNFKKNFAIGITLHQDALRCAREIQKSIGALYSIQVAESISLLVVCLLKLSENLFKSQKLQTCCKLVKMFERNVTSVVKNVTFISCLLLLNGTYMIAGGDVTYEASQVPDAVFHCGWEYSSAGASLRSLVVVTLQSSQVPIRMTAFGVLSLSYNSFITVLRLAYSFFAVMY